MVLVKVSGLWGTSAALAEGIPTDPPKPGILRASHHQIPHRPMVSLHDIWPLETQYMNSIALIWIQWYPIHEQYLSITPWGHYCYTSYTPTPIKVTLAKRLVSCRADVTARAWRGAVSGKTPLELLESEVKIRSSTSFECWVVGPPNFPPFFWGVEGTGSSDCWYMLALMGGIWYFFAFFFVFCFFLFGIRLWTCLWPIGLYDRFDFWRIYDHFNRFIGSSQVYSTLTVDTKVVPREKPKNSKNLSSIGRGWLIGCVLKWMKLIPTSRWTFSLNMLAATQREAWCSWILWVQFFDRSPPLLLSCAWLGYTVAQVHLICGFSVAQWTLFSLASFFNDSSATSWIGSIRRNTYLSYMCIGFLEVGTDVM